jgi:hypothetical protein
MKENFVRTQ